HRRRYLSPEGLSLAWWCLLNLSGLPRVLPRSLRTYLLYVHFTGFVPVGQADGLEQFHLRDVAAARILLGPELLFELIENDRKPLHIGLDCLSQRWLMQGCGRMIHRDNHPLADLTRFAVDAGNALVGKPFRH